MAYCTKSFKVAYLTQYISLMTPLYLFNFRSVLVHCFLPLLFFIPLLLSITNHIYNCLVVTRIHNKGCFIKNDSCMPSQTLTSMGLLWRCYTVEMASFRLTQMTPPKHSWSANQRWLACHITHFQPITKNSFWGKDNIHWLNWLKCSHRNTIILANHKTAFKFDLKLAWGYTVSLMKYRTGLSNL